MRRGKGGGSGLDPGQIFRSVRTRRRRVRLWHPHAWWSWTILITLVIVALGAGVLVWYYLDTERALQEPVEPVTPVADSDAPFNALLVGSDSRAGLTPEEHESLGADPVEGERADTLILAHVDPADNRVTLVQFPRDLYVPIAGAGSDKINEALERGDATLVRTVEALTGLDVNHYVKVNIAGFRQLVDAIGGVSVCITEAIPFDPQTGIEIGADELGMVEFDGDRALRFVRTRAFENGDFQRIHNQQKFVAAAVDKVLSAGSLLNAARIKRVVDVARVNVSIDEHTSLRELVGLGRRFESFDPDRYEAYTAPNLGIATNEAGSVVVPDRDAMAVMFGALAANESPAAASDVPPVDPSAIVLDVLNGTAKAGAAAAAAAAIEEATASGGEKVAIGQVANADRFGYRRTQVLYGDGRRAGGELIAAALPGSRLRPGDTGGADVVVVVGRNFEVRRVVQIRPIDLPEPGRLPAICRS